MDKPTINLFLDTRTKYLTNKYPVKITVYYNGAMRRYGIPFSFTEDEWKKIHGPKLRDGILKKKKNEMNPYINEKFETALKKIKGKFTFEEFKFAYFENTPKLKTLQGKRDVYTLYENYIIQLQNATKDQVGNAQVYRSTIKKFKEYKKKLSFTDVTVKFLEGFEEYMIEEREKSVAYTGMCLRNLKTIFNKAIAEGLVDASKYPFSRSVHDKGFRIKKGSGNKKALTMEQLQALRNYQPTTFAQRRAYLYWWFSFYANGINMKDVCLLKNKNITDRIEFVRRKTAHSTSDVVTVRMIYSPQLKAIVDEIGNVDKSPEAYVFDILEPGANYQRIKDMVDSLNRNITKHFKKISENLKFEKPITSNWARHSFATYLKRSGVSTEVISEALAHTSIDTTRIYLDSFHEDVLNNIAGLLAKI